MVKLRIYLVLAAAAAGSALTAHEPAETLNRYFAFFNPGDPGGLEEFRSCFVPESRERIRTVPPAEIRNSAPVGQVRIIDELKSSRRYEVRYRLENREGTGFLVLENRNGTWLIHPELSRIQRESAEVPKNMISAVTPNPKNPAPQPLPKPKRPWKIVIPASWRPGPSPEWHVDYRAAAEQAAAERKKLYVLCTAPDTYIWSKKLEKDVLQSEEFKSYASNHLVLLYLNFPRRSPLPETQKKHNQAIRSKLGFGGKLPSAILLDPDGQFIGWLPGYAALPDYMEFLRTGKDIRQTGQMPAAAPTVRAAAPTVRTAPQRKKPAAAAAPANETPRGWLKGPDPGWQIVFPKALEEARQKHKKIFVLSTGSDWCGWCIKLKKDVLTQREFKRFAQKNLILVYLDNPKRKVMPQDQKRHNQEVKSKLGFGPGVPAFAILDENGQVILKQPGYRPLKDFMKILKNAVKK